MYARVACATGWTWEYIGQCMTLPRLYAMQDYWKGAPPVHESVAAYLGIKAEPVAPPAAAEEALDLMALIRSAPITAARGSHGR